MGLIRRIPVLLCLGVLALSILLLVADFVAAAVAFSTLVRIPHTISVPDTIDLDLGQDAPTQILWREYHGPHITVNRPLLDVPEDLAVTITDRQTGETIEPNPAAGRQALRILDIGVARHALRNFTPPTHGQITIDVQGTFAHEQVYAVGPHANEWNQVLAKLIYVVAIGAGVLLLASLLVLLLKALDQQREFSLDAGE